MQEASAFCVLPSLQAMMQGASLGALSVAPALQEALGVALRSFCWAAEQSSLMPCCRLRGDLVQLDISNPENPKVASRIWLGGVIRKGSPVEVQQCGAVCHCLSAGLGSGSVLQPGCIAAALPLQLCMESDEPKQVPWAGLQPGHPIGSACGDKVGEGGVVEVPSSLSCVSTAACSKASVLWCSAGHQRLT